MKRKTPSVLTAPNVPPSASEEAILSPTEDGSGGWRLQRQGGKVQVTIGVKTQLINWNNKTQTESARYSIVNTTSCLLGVKKLTAATGSSRRPRHNLHTFLLTQRLRRRRRLGALFFKFKYKVGHYNVVYKRCWKCCPFSRKHKATLLFLFSKISSNTSSLRFSLQKCVMSSINPSNVWTLFL